MPSSLQTLKNQVSSLRERLAKEGVHMFLGIPDYWCDPPGPKYRCCNDHVSKTILKSEGRGDLCLECQTSVIMTFPEDVDGPWQEPPTDFVKA